ncbi:hypothetical protein FsymDg_2422 [Candidatus Protofrankia datiscae]|uniref:Uncharacterized protein n=1 Tax=Candidatus Protofrankia datiscae TaxID=2716812 RepID=F8B1D2_9ACTN|nr:hypothetical protein FsymDg_2422 [Candidatus Protofrankia datiscae]
MAGDVDAPWVEAAAVGLPAERGDRPGMRENELRILPHRGQRFVEVVGGGRAGADVDALFEVGVVEEVEAAVVE